MKYFLPVLAIALISSCAQLPREAPADRSAPIYGWLAGNCLALTQGDLSIPHDFTLIDFSHEQKRVHGVVLRVAADTDNCPALLSDRQEVNMASGNTFYVVKLDTPADLGIGIVGTVPAKPLAFEHCMTSEGIRFRVVRGHQQVWDGYYYLGYDNESTCVDPDGE